MDVRNKDMKYRITIEEVIETKENKYPTHNEIYQQTVFGLDVEWLVSIINNRNE